MPFDGDETTAALEDLAAHQPGDTIQFYEAEGRALELWDQLQETKLERALLEAAQTRSVTGEQAGATRVTEEQVKEAENGYLEERARYQLKRSIVEDVLVTDPVLKAVHSGEDATPTERDIHPLLILRDTLGIAHTNLCETLQSLEKQIMVMEVDHIRSMEKDRALTREIVDLTNAVQKRKDDIEEDPRFSAELRQAMEDTATAKRRYRMMKSVIAATIAGSGVDWARDDELRGLVLDDEEEVE